MNDDVANDVTATTLLELDTVTLFNAAAIRMVSLVAINQTAGNSAAVVIAPEIHSSADTVRMMNMIAQYFECLIGPTSFADIAFALQTHRFSFLITQNSV